MAKKRKPNNSDKANSEPDNSDDLARRYGPDAEQSKGLATQGLDDSDDSAGATEVAPVNDEAAGDAAEALPEELPVEPSPESADTQLDEDQDPALDADVVEPPPPAKVKTGRGVAWFSLLLALASLGGAGYMYYELIHKQPLQALSAEVSTQLNAAVASAKGDESASAAKFAQLQNALRDLNNQQSAALQELASEQQAQLASTEQGLISSLNKVANATPPSQQQWKLAEVEYLLRIANHRVLMEADAKGALQVLSTADAILQELDDFGLHGVRAQLADEMLSLKQVRAEDLQGLFLRLEALKRQLDELPLRIPEFRASSEPSQAASSGGVLESLSKKLAEYVQIRRLQTPVKPLLGPDETMYLELNLRLMLERAQLAALRQQQEVYEQSLSSAQEWLEQYLDPQSTEVAALVEEIDGLLGADLSRELPDISGSLRSLLATERGSS